MNIGKRTSRHGFTMVEIALAIAVVGFALVAIIGVLPTALGVQRDNREETIIQQDALYWMELLRGGAVGGPAIVEPFVKGVEWGVDGKFYSGLTTPEIVGLLTTPYVTNRARVRAFSGSLIERDTNTIAFEYILSTKVFPVPENTNAVELTLQFRWPVREDGTDMGKPGRRGRVFRTLASGVLLQTNGLTFLRPHTFGRAR